MWDSSAGIGALRPMKFAKYLLRAGHNVTVVCGMEVAHLENPGTELVYLRSLPGYAEKPVMRCTGVFEMEDRIVRRNKAAAIAKKYQADTQAATPGVVKRHGVVKRMAIAILNSDCFQSMKKRNIVQNAYRCLRSERMSPDVILSTYEPLETHLLGSKLKKRYPHAFWIADFRDPMPNKTYQSERLYRAYQKKQREIGNQADAVTIVSETWRKEFELDHIRRTHTVYSGFDPDDYDIMRGQAVRADQLVFTYTGSLYEELDTLLPFFTVLQKLVDAGKIDPKKIAVVYAGKNGAEFQKQAAALPAGIACVNHGFIPREQALKLLAQSDALLHALFCFPNNTGTITGKLGEYLLADKPIVSVINGTVEASEYKSIIERSGAGFIFEIKNYPAHEPLLCDYIEKLYRQKFSNGGICFHTDKSYVDAFNYKHIAEQLITMATSTVLGAK